MYIYYIARASSKILIYSLVQSASDFVRGAGGSYAPSPSTIAPGYLTP